VGALSLYAANEADSVDELAALSAQTQDCSFPCELCRSAHIREARLANVGQQFCPGVSECEASCVVCYIHVLAVDAVSSFVLSETVNYRSMGYMMAAAVTFDPSPSTVWGDRAVAFATECQSASSDALISRFSLSSFR
jgi:hypothetical protein